jgi:hypothetical protein
LNDRLKNIEELVSSLISKENATQPGSHPRGVILPGLSAPPLESPPKSTMNDRCSPLGPGSAPGRELPHFLHDHNGEAVYMEPSHWMSILHDIKDMRADLSSHGSHTSNELASSQNLGLEPDINLGIALRETLSISDVLNSLPPQPTCDVLLSQYFNSRYMVLGMYWTVYRQVFVN